MVINPLNMLKRARKFRARVREEVGFILERHGSRAREAALEELNRPGLSPARAKVLEAAVRSLKTN